MTRGLTLFAALAALTLAAPAIAQDHSGHQMPATEDAVGDAAAAAYKAAMDKMHADMGAVQPSGSADVDFVRGMIPHHQAAIDMAKVQLEYGSDPEIRKMSEAIIAAQESEIAEMKEWLSRNAPD